jgi:sigma-B regulation protein RsbU (phosphoserine phosphatase)
VATPSRALSSLTRTFTGRALVGGVAAKSVAALLALLGIGSASLAGAIDTIGSAALIAGALTLGYSIFIYARRRLLWRVRRKLILFYLFTGVVPVLLVGVFFALAGLLFFFNVSAFMLRSHVESVVEATRYLAQSAAPIVGQASDPTRAGRVMIDRQTEAAARYPLVSYALVPSASPCAGGTAATLYSGAGPWAHRDIPDEIPDWIPCAGFVGLVAYEAEGEGRVAARAVEWIRGSGRALVVDVPFGDELVRRFHDETGITIQAYTALDSRDDGAEGVDGGRDRAVDGGLVVVGPLNVRVGRESGEDWLGWVAFLDATNWDTGGSSTLAVGFGLGLAAVYRYVSGPSFAGLGNINSGQIILISLAVVGGLFFVIQAMAMVMGLTLARSITGSVHELFEGTERVRQGDFSHKVVVHSRDQLGELASSFNSMTASIEDLLQEKAEKERLEQELRVARSIQMSLLPQTPPRIPGLVLAGHCEPAREVGGDYYDFLPIDDHRLGILIADVAGKGISAALYMAELKGLVLSLSQRHVSPRELLIDANRIISRHLDPGSFITMTYAVVDRAARTLTFARAGHCPLVHVPGPYAASRAPQSLTPDGMVMGLQFDTGNVFERLLKEVTLPLDRGDLFLLYTDGMSDAMNEQGDCFGDNRLAELVSEHADLSPSQLRERVLREVHAFAGSAARHDDMTMVLVKVEEV